MDWPRLWSYLGLAYGWGPAIIGELTWPQLLIYYQSRPRSVSERYASREEALRRGARLREVRDGWVDAQMRRIRRFSNGLLRGTV